MLWFPLRGLLQLVSFGSSPACSRIVAHRKWAGTGGSFWPAAPIQTRPFGALGPEWGGLAWVWGELLLVLGGLGELRLNRSKGREGGVTWGQPRPVAPGQHG